MRVRYSILWVGFSCEIMALCFPLPERSLRAWSVALSTWSSCSSSFQCLLWITWPRVMLCASRSTRSANFILALFLWVRILVAFLSMWSIWLPCCPSAAWSFSDLRMTSSISGGATRSFSPRWPPFHCSWSTSWPLTSRRSSCRSPCVGF